MGQTSPNKVLVNLGQFRLQAVRIADGTLNFRPAQQLHRLQPMQASNKRVVLGDSDGVHQAHGGDTPGQFLHVSLLGIPPSWIDFDFTDFDLHDEKRNIFWKQKAQELYSERICAREEHIYARKEEGYFYPCDISWHSTFISHLGRMQACTKTSYQSYDLLHGDFQTGWDFLKKEFRDKKKLFSCLKCEKFHYCEQCSANFLCDNNSNPQIDPFYCSVAQLRYDYVESEVKKIEEGK